MSTKKMTLYFLSLAILFVLGCTAFEQRVAYIPFAANGTNTVSGFVTMTQISPNNTVVTGQWNTGFDDPDLDNYKIGFQPSGYDLLAKIKPLLIVQNGGTAGWTTSLDDITLQDPAGSKRRLRKKASGPQANLNGNQLLLGHKGLQIGAGTVFH